MPSYRFTSEQSCWFRYDITLCKYRGTLLEGTPDVLKYRMIRGGKSLHPIQKKNTRPCSDPSVTVYTRGSNSRAADFH